MTLNFLMLHHKFKNENLASHRLFPSNLFKRLSEIAFPTWPKRPDLVIGIQAETRDSWK